MSDRQLGTQRVGFAVAVAAFSFFDFRDFDIVGLLIRIFVMCLSLSLHECAHSWIALRLGDDTSALMGRLSLNPARHLDPLGALTFLLIGVGWAKPVPVNPTRMTKAKSMKHGMMLTSLAGPVSNLLLAVVSWTLFCVIWTILSAVGVVSNLMLTLSRLFLTLYSANVLLAVFNLLPVPPLDGSRVFGFLLPDRYLDTVMRYERYIGMAFLVFVFVFRNAFTTLLSWILVPFNYAIQYPITLLFRAIQSALGYVPMPFFM
ncbi:MAG: site-2 protease family protein [Clostridiaceae bacterium]|nr:site-2 protease family protein [Clostridiaceae bacterium]